MPGTPTPSGDGCAWMIVAALTCLGVTYGCSNKGQSGADFEARTKLDLMETRLKALESERLDRVVADRSVIYMEPGEDGFSFITSDVGAFTMKLVDLKPFASGSKATIQFGNPSGARVIDMSADFQWGPNGAEGMPDPAQSRSAKITIPGDFPAGKWVTKTVALSDMPPAKIGYIKVSGLKTSRIALGPE